MHAQLKDRIEDFDVGEQPSSRKPEGRTIRERITELLPMIREYADEGERLTHAPEPVLNKLHEAGAFMTCLPEKFGGYALGARDNFEIYREMAKGNGATGWNAVVATQMDLMGLVYPDAAIEEVFGKPWVGPRLAGSIFSGKKAAGYSKRVDGGWMVKGSWGFSSGIQHAAWLIAGIDFLNEEGEPDRATVLIPRSEFQVKDDWHVMGMKATSTNTAVVAEDTFVPDHRFMRTAELLERLGGVKDKYEGLTFKLDTNVGIRPLFGALAIGMARGAFELFVTQTKSRTPFGVPYPTLNKAPTVQSAAGRIAGMLDIAETILLNAVDEIDRAGLEGRTFGPDDRFRIGINACQAAHMCNDAVKLMHETIGSSAAALANPLQRYVRDLQVLSLHGMYRFDFMAEEYGRHVLGEPVYNLGLF